MAQLWKSFVKALAPPQRAERPRREGVTLNHMVGEHPLSCHEPSNQAESQSSRAPPEYQEVAHADLNIASARETSARVGEVNLDSDVKFQDSREVLPTRSLADSITVTRSLRQPPQRHVTVITQTELTSHQTTWIWRVSTDSQFRRKCKCQSYGKFAGGVRYFHNTALGYQDVYKALQQHQ